MSKLEINISFKRAVGSMAKLSARSPATLFVSVHEGTLARNGVVVTVNFKTLLLIVGCIARHGGIFERNDIFQAFYGDREDGGPTYFECTLRKFVVSARVASVALGYRIENHHGIGYSAHPITSAGALQ